MATSHMAVIIAGQRGLNSFHEAEITENKCGEITFVDSVGGYHDY